jgi:hypothetical protein
VINPYEALEIAYLKSEDMTGIGYVLFRHAYFLDPKYNDREQLSFAVETIRRRYKFTRRQVEKAIDSLGEHGWFNLDHLTGVKEAKRTPSVRLLTSEQITKKIFPSAN